MNDGVESDLPAAPGSAIDDPSATLHLLPVPISDVQGLAVIPASTRAAAHALRHFVAENARSARRALRDLGHPGPLQTLEIAEIPVLKDGSTPEPDVIARLLAPLAAGHSIGVLSESGCPGIADPGSEVVAWAQAHGFRVMAHVGPSSLLLALMGSGLQGQRFAFHGYLPVDPQARCARIRALETQSAREDASQIFIETPYRNAVMFTSLLETLQDDTRLTLACDLTGPAEMLRTRTAADWRGAMFDLPRLPTVFLVQADPGSPPAPPLRSPKVGSGGRRASAGKASGGAPRDATAGLPATAGRQVGNSDRHRKGDLRGTSQSAPGAARSQTGGPRPPAGGARRRKPPPRGGPGA